MKQTKTSKGISLKDKAVLGWVALSFAVLVSTSDAPTWFLILSLLNFAASAYFACGTEYAGEEEETTQQP